MSEERPRRGFLYWLPRLVVAGSVLGMVLPTPGFLSRLSRDEKVLWWSEVLWVLTVPLVFVGVLLGILHLAKRIGGRDHGGEG